MASGRASGSKRPLDCDEIEKISEIHSPSKKARVHGVLASVLPMKSSNRGIIFTVRPLMGLKLFDLLVLTQAYSKS